MRRLRAAYQALFPSSFSSSYPQCFTWYIAERPVRGADRRAYTQARRDAALDPRTAAISYLSPLLAVIVGVLHAALAPVIVVAGVKPNLVLVAVVLVTTLVGFLPGITWAFVGGLTANLLIGDPLGSVPLALLLVAVVVAGGGRVLGRMVWIYPVLAALAGSMVADVISLLLSQLATETTVVAAMPFDLIVRAAVLNAGVAALLLYPVRAIATRYVADELPAW